MELTAQLVLATGTALVSGAAAWGATRTQLRALEGQVEDLCDRLTEAEKTQNHHETKISLLDQNLSHYGAKVEEMGGRLEAGILRVENEVKSVHKRLDEVLLLRRE